jgi:CheY-like chemotaxis protein
MGQRKKILVIDDEEQICSVTKIILEKTGKYEAIVTTESAAAIDLAVQNKPDLVLLDINMPQMDGGEIAQRLRQLPATNQIPIIFVTGLLQKDEVKDRDGKVARNYFIAKPITSKELIAKVESILEPSGQI